MVFLVGTDHWSNESAGHVGRVIVSSAPIADCSAWPCWLLRGCTCCAARWKQRPQAPPAGGRWASVRRGGAVPVTLGRPVPRRCGRK